MQLLGMGEAVVVVLQPDLSCPADGNEPAAAVAEGKGLSVPPQQAWPQSIHLHQVLSSDRDFYSIDCFDQNSQRI